MKHAPGVMCLITGAVSEEGLKDVGKVVELVKFMQRGDIYPVNDKYNIRLMDSAAWLVKGDVVGSELKYGYVFKGQKNLMPIDGYKEDHKQRELDYGR